MSIEFQGKTIETTATGYLVNAEDWSEALAEHMAQADELPLTSRHWDVINYLREEYFQGGGSQPNTRNMVKHCAKTWGGKVNAKDLYDLFPGDPSKQAGRLAGLPESRRKGGY